MSFSETIFLFVLALIIFGPKKLPEIARQLGGYLNQFKRASNEFKAQIEQEISHLETENKPQILSPSWAPEGATSRSPNPSGGGTELNPPATLAASADPESAATPVPAKSELVATEAVAGSDAVSVSTSQESHA